MPHYAAVQYSMGRSLLCAVRQAIRYDSAGSLTDLISKLEIHTCTTHDLPMVYNAYSYYITVTCTANITELTLISSCYYPLPQRQ